MKTSNSSVFFLLAAIPTITSSFSVSKSKYVSRNLGSRLNMGIFDKQDISDPGLGRTPVDSDRETPIDRWFGWSTKPMDEEDVRTFTGSKEPANFIDSMDPANYVSVSLEKPMGIIFEENDDEFSGIYVVSLDEGSVAAESGVLKPGDQLVAVNEIKTAGMPFDDALGSIVSTESEKTKLLCFRGSAKQLYGPTGASQAWLDEFISSGGVATTSE